jgi:hypothetical protein
MRRTIRRSEPLGVRSRTGAAARRATLAAVALAVLAACFLPQPLPDYPPGTITPPRILVATATHADTSIVTVPANCEGGSPRYPLSARVFYQDSETVEARWFVDYKKDVAARWAIQNTFRDVLAHPEYPTILEREVPPFEFRPYDYPPPVELRLPTGAPWSAPGIVHVVELVVSNGFDPSLGAPEPNRTPAIDGLARFEIQTFRWVFVNVAELPCPLP